MSLRASSPSIGGRPGSDPAARPRPTSSTPRASSYAPPRRGARSRSGSRRCSPTPAPRLHGSSSRRPSDRADGTGSKQPPKLPTTRFGRSSRTPRPTATNSGSQSDGPTRLDGTTPPRNASSTPHPFVPAAPLRAISTMRSGSSTGPPATSDGSVHAWRQASTATDTPYHSATTPTRTSTSMTQAANSTQ